MTTASTTRLLTVFVPDEPDDDTLARLKRLSDQLDAAKKSVDVTAREIARPRVSGSKTAGDATK